MAPPPTALLLTAMAHERGASFETMPGADTVTRSPAEWRSLLDAAEWYRVTPALATWLDDQGTTPDWVRARLRAAAERDTAFGLVLDHTRRSALAALAGDGIPAMLLKGSALVEFVYPPGIPREMGDLDILVPPARIDAGRAALEAAGFELGEKPVYVSPGRRHELPLYGVGRLVPIELHRRIVDGVDPLRFPIEGVWARAQPGVGDDHLVPSPEDLLIHVCLHFVEGRAISSRGALGQIRDIAWLADRGGIDWEQLDRLVREAEVRDRVQLALRTAELLGQLTNCPLLSSDGGDVRRVRAFVSKRVLLVRDDPPALELIWQERERGKVRGPSFGSGLEEMLSRRLRSRWRLRLTLRLLRNILRHPSMVPADVRMFLWLRRLA